MSDVERETFWTVEVQDSTTHLEGQPPLREWNPLGGTLFRTKRYASLDEASAAVADWAERVRHMPARVVRVEQVRTVEAQTDTVPDHYNADGEWCAGGGQPPNRFGKCPYGCDHAEHYANDGHPGCEDTSGEPRGRAS